MTSGERRRRRTAKSRRKARLRAQVKKVQARLTGARSFDVFLKLKNQDLVDTLKYVRVTNPTSKAVEIEMSGGFLVPSDFPTYGASPVASIRKLLSD